MMLVHPEPLDLQGAADRVTPTNGLMSSVLAWGGEHSLEDTEEQPELLAALVQPEQWLTSFLFKREKGKKL